MNAASDHDRPPSQQHTTDHLANERTFLAWIRTAVAIIGLGFVVSRFALYLRSLAALGGVAVPATPGRSAVLGVVLVGLGAVTVVLALARYLMNYRSIEANDYRPSHYLDIFLALLIALAAIVMMAVLLTTSGPT
jgi:putative membrane protein